LTQHDPLHLHATLGFSCLLSFLYFYASMIWHWDLPRVPPSIMVLHCTLSFSSLLFTVPMKRNLKNPTIIWEEYRLHACAFTLRSLVIHMVATMPPSPATSFLRLCVVMCTGLAADYITKRWGEKGITTVRGPGLEKIKSKAVRRLIPIYASYQIIAVVSHLYTHARSHAAGFNTLVAIQSRLLRRNKIICKMCVLTPCSTTVHSV
jgi:hypothetical protein